MKFPVFGVLKFHTKIESYLIFSVTGETAIFTSENWLKLVKKTLFHHLFSPSLVKQTNNEPPNTITMMKSNRRGDC